MQKIKTTITLFVAVMLIVLSIPSASVSAVELRYGKTVISQMSNKDALNYVYNRLVDSCAKAQPEEINIDTTQYKLTLKEITDLYHIFLADYPEYFWLDLQFGYIDNNYEYIVSLIPNYTIEGEQLTQANDKFKSKVNSLIAGLNSKSDYEKSLILHDRLANLTKYTLQCNNHQNAYGALVEGEAVCAGYSKAYQHLLHKVGIPAWCVMGESINPANNHMEAHEWNLVCLDDKWYYTDVTWDDQDDYLFYAYFNITTKQMEENHIVTEFKEYLPSATSTDANYFYKNNRVYSSLDINKLANQLKADDFKTRIFVTGDIQTFINNLINNFNSLMQKAGVPTNYGYTCRPTAIGGEICLDVILIDPNHKHNLTVVSAKTATCTEKGNIAYYICNGCRMMFKDSTAQNEIVDIKSIEIAAVPHTASGWKYNSIKHWKICTKCGIEIANSTDRHIDNDKNDKCDACSYKPPQKQPSVNPNQTPTASTQNDNTINTSSPTDSSESTTENTTSSQETTTEKDTTFEPEDTPVAQAIPKKKFPILPIAVGSGSVAIIGAGVGIFFILRRK